LFAEKENVTDTETKIKQQAEWLKLHTLTQEQTKVLIQNKLRRAVDMHNALNKREVLCKHR
jgi:hypothetical protein